MHASASMVLSELPESPDCNQQGQAKTTAEQNIRFHFNPQKSLPGRLRGVGARISAAVCVAAPCRFDVFVGLVRRGTPVTDTERDTIVWWILPLLPFRTRALAGLSAAAEIGAARYVASRVLQANLHLPVVKIPSSSDSVCVFAVLSTRSICTCIDRASVKPKVFAAA